MKPLGRVEPAPPARSFSLVWRAGVLTGPVLTLAACATVVLSAHEPFQIVSSPPGARVQLSTGESCRTPCTLELPRAVAFQARVSLPGYATQMLSVVSRTSVGGAVGFLGNGVIGGVVGAGTDLESGATRSLSPNPLSVRLYPLPAQDH